MAYGIDLDYGPSLPDHIWRQDASNVVGLSLECLILKLLNQSCFRCEISPENFQLFAVTYAVHYRAYFVMLSVTVGLPNFFVADFFGRRLCLDYPSPRFIHDENVVWKTLQRPSRFLGSSENLLVILEL
jgi:hypothetical protein